MLLIAMAESLSVAAEGLTQSPEWGCSKGLQVYIGSDGPHRLWDQSTRKGKKPPTPLSYHSCDNTDEPATLAGENYRENILRIAI